MILNLIITFVLITTLGADPRCPFPSCDSYYNEWESSCNIYCSSSIFPDIGYPIVNNKIRYFVLRNIEIIPPVAFENLSIYQIEIYGKNLNTVDKETFKNIVKLDHLYLNSISDLNLFYQDQLDHLQNLTYGFGIYSTNITNVEYLFEKIKIMPNLNEIYLHYNNLSHFEYNFNTAFKNLRELSLRYNRIETFNISSDFIRYLYVDSNKIKNLESIMFDQLPNLTYISASDNLIESFEFPKLNKLNYLILNLNKIKSLANNSFENVTNINRLQISSNLIDYIEPGTFCILEKLNDLSLSSNNLSTTTLYCLESLAHLYLSSVKFQGTVTQERIGNPVNLRSLDLSGNQIDELKIANMTKITDLNLNTNKFSNLSAIDFSLLLDLNDLRFSSNLLTEIRPEHLEKNQKLAYLYLTGNYLTDIKFSNLTNLQYLFLDWNKLKTIKNNVFSELTGLEELNIANNLIEKIDTKSFEKNQKLRRLNLDGNKLSTVPDIRELTVLNYLSLYNNKITSLPNFAFERNLDEANIMQTNIEINLNRNNIQKYSSKTFCSQYSYSFGFLGIQLNIDDISLMNKCMLKQIKSDNTKINTNRKPGCEYFLFAKNQSISLSGDFSSCENSTIDVTECLNNEKYKCPKDEDFVRFTTWITGDPHLYSYKSKYELCSTGQDAVCFKYKNFEILCTDEQAGGLNQIATVLTKVKFIYTKANGEKISFESNQTSFPSNFDNELMFISDNLNGKKSVELVNFYNDTKIIYIQESKTHIFISRWNSYYSISLRATHETYAESSGFLYEGCRLMDNRFKISDRLNRFKRNDNISCNSECSKINVEVDDEDVPEDVIRNSCNFDCNEIGLDSIQMIKNMVNLMNVIIQSDNVDLVDLGTTTELPATSEETATPFEETTLSTIESTTQNFEASSDSTIESTTIKATSTIPTLTTDSITIQTTNLSSTTTKEPTTNPTFQNINQTTESVTETSNKTTSTNEPQTTTSKYSATLTTDGTIEPEKTTTEVIDTNKLNSILLLIISILLFLLFLLLIIIFCVWICKNKNRNRVRNRVRKSDISMEDL